MENFKTIGIMTGNSLDGVDVVLTEFNGISITDICGYSKPVPLEMKDAFLYLKRKIAEFGGDIEKAIQVKDMNFEELHNSYIQLVAESVNEMIAENNIDRKTVNAIGFHGQTCGHCPPSVAKTRDKGAIYTIQLGNGQMLADLTGIPVVFDCRSDDLMNQGEAAPLAPMHNKHIAIDLEAKGLEFNTIAFCNGGNIGNIAVIFGGKNKDRLLPGWDAGPFNHFIDTLCKNNPNIPHDYDKDGMYGSKGKVNFEIIRAMFNHAVPTKNGENFLLASPPKSSDPGWFKMVPELVDESIPFKDRLRSAEFFSAYIFVHTLSLLPQDTPIPDKYLVFGGGWKNPLVMQDFKDLLSGKAEVLPEHKEIFAKVKVVNPYVEWSDKYGYSGQYMEARIFADIAKCFFTKEPFTYPQTTGCNTPTVAGILAEPNGNNHRLWSRAAKGWASK